MASGVRVRVLRNRLPEIAKQLPITADSIVMKRGQEMVEIAKGLSRYDTSPGRDTDKPHMRDGWTWRRTSNASGVLENPVPWTVHNEYGTVNMSAQPMARPAAEQVLPEIVDDFRNLERFLS